MGLTGVGVWSNQLRYGNPSESADAAAELDDLGFTALWIPDVGGPVFDAIIAWGDGVQVLPADAAAFPREQWRRIAAACR
jgi:hypothetical protein